jgi:small subunit ribosomal protein S8e
MVLWHKERKRKVSGSFYERWRDKRKHELGRQPAMTKVSDKDVVSKIHIAGTKYKNRALKLSTANVFDPNSKKFQKAKITKVVENKASRHFARMAVITKGAIIDTELGKAKVTNRPGQEGTINAILIK